MVIQYASYRGGIIGETKRDILLDTKTLGYSEANKVQCLVNQAGFFQLQSNECSSVGCGGVRYKISVYHSHSCHHYECYGDNIPQKLIPLIDYLEDAIDALRSYFEI